MAATAATNEDTTVPVMVVSSLPLPVSLRATGSSFTPWTVMVRVAVSVAPCSSVTV